MTEAFDCPVGPKPKMRVSVIVPVRDEEHSIRALLDAGSQDDPVG